MSNNLKETISNLQKDFTANPKNAVVLQKEQTPFKFAHYGDEWLSTLKKYSKKPFKATVISPSAVSLIYKDEIPGYSILKEGLQSVVTLREHKLIVDEPKSFGGKDEGPKMLRCLKE